MSSESDSSSGSDSVGEEASFDTAGWGCVETECDPYRLAISN